MLRKGAHDVKLCPRCYLRGRVERLQGNSCALSCLGCGRVFPFGEYLRARSETYNELQRRIRSARYEEVQDVSAAAT